MLDVASVDFAYPGGNPVLSDIAFSVRRGEVLAIVGRNGAGKSTLLRLLNGLRQPASGTVTVDGLNTADTPVHVLAHHIGTVFQAPEQQIFNAKVHDEIAFGPRQQGLTGAALEARIAEVLGRIGLADAAQLHPLDLDAAARRLVALGSVLAMKPPVLLLDEPQRGLDANAMARLEAIVAEEAEAGTCVILVCHDMDFVARRASRVLALAQGRIAADLPTLDFFTSDELTRKAGVEVPDPVELARFLGLPPVLTPSALAAKWLADHRSA
ncbi:ABC transporter ATP-binding protein [Kaistia dalseonensis]|uniref:Energy-coupling factor transport system ATP-binding protein n=1 Tax=Kaistia dalseonensis TaxID=410840 RepID=A0ABU0HAK8_9HYPH|nr:ABC transporter ATP-binding protein [Kaistia dalseonensis]MCX5496680.1 ABC transporter ATP-binding protein [Kaistia dalseonensis]MDQ0439305.1 energy-coupling factor transport system ATP-binding protein [Kaistia dalseonensis]